MDREKVLKGLEYCKEYFSCCSKCPYWQDKLLCTSHLVRDALELLKEQEPRVMTLEEVKAFGWDYCYLEEARLPDKEYLSACGYYALTCITWPRITLMRMRYGDDSYGKKWRCWSAKPTDEQRQAVKWDD